MNTLVYLVVTIGFITILLLLWLSTSVKLNQEREKLSAFECGFDFLSALRLPFSLNFFFITIVFLIFDVELVLILPFVFNMSTSSVKLHAAVLILFFSLLMVSLMYEWVAGFFNWMV